MKNQPQNGQHGLTVRVLFLVLLIAPINCYLLIQMELVRYTFPTWVVPLSNVIFILAGVLILDRLIRFVVPSLAFRASELLLLYVMLSFATTLAGCDVLQAVLSVLGHAFWFATEENEWKTLLWPHIPDWLTVNDKKALQGYYLGESSFYTNAHLRVWAPVILAWLALFLVLTFIFLCLNTILRRQWADRERLTFPIIQLPLQMTNPALGFFRNKRMWIGFAIAAGISLFNGLSTLYPSIPHIPVTRRFFTFLDPPLSFYDGVTVAFYPFAIGIMFLMPLDVLFSTALFYFLYRNELALASVYGLDTLPKFPYQDEQAFGAFLGLCVFFLWVGRHHFKRVLLSAFRRQSDDNDMKEPMRYRTGGVGTGRRAYPLCVCDAQSGHVSVDCLNVQPTVSCHAHHHDPHSRRSRHLRARLPLASAAIRPEYDSRIPAARSPKPDGAVGMLFQPGLSPSADASPVGGVQDRRTSQYQPAANVGCHPHLNRDWHCGLFLGSTPPIL